MQTARDLIGIAVELAARMQLGHDHLSGGHAFAFVDTDRNTAPVIAHSDRAVGVDPYIDMIGVTGQSLVNAVIHDLVNHMVQTGPVISITDIHTGTLTNSL